MIKISSSAPTKTEFTYKEIVESGRFGWYKNSSLANQPHSLLYMNERGAVLFEVDSKVPHQCIYKDCMSWTSTYEFVAREINITLEIPK